LPFVTPRAIAGTSVPTSRRSPATGDSEAREPAAAQRPTLTRLEATRLGDAIDVTRGYPRPSKPAADGLSCLDSHERRLSRLLGRVELDEQLAVVAQEGGGPREQAGGSATDADVAVEQQRGAPAAAAGELVEHRCDDRSRSAPRSELDGRRGQVHPEREHAVGCERVEVTAGPAADIEDRAADPRQQPPIRLISGAEIAVEWQRPHGAVLTP
jgi:hypothetical protein